MNDRQIRKGSGHSDFYNKVISLENLFSAWAEFRQNKNNRLDIQEFKFNLEDVIFELHERLKNKTWTPDKYIAFYIKDPKLRHIHKATVRDRVFNQALFRVLYQIFDPIFIFDSFSCRIGKGVHKGSERLQNFARKLSGNYRKPIYALKCDVRKYFDNISHEKMFELIKRKVSDPDVLDIIFMIINSFHVKPGKGLPLGNVTSQLFANIYLNELDQFAKHELKAKYYIRYCDDFIILHEDKTFLQEMIKKIDVFLKTKLDLSLHPNKVTIRRLSEGIDFLGYIVMPYFKVVRLSTKKRILRKIRNAQRNLKNNLISEESFEHILQSYLGILKHCKGHKIHEEILRMVPQNKPLNKAILDKK
jgi:retron-type reverse transcriptase